MRGKRQVKWLRVDPSAVRAVRYNSSRSELEVRFEEGREYRYSHVPRSKFRALLQAESIGAFVNHEIKPHHACEEITYSFR
jgi:KTSC domain-containing protein